MKKILLLLIALAASVAAWAWDGSGSQSAPYLIKTTDDLVTLSTNRASNGYNGTYFRLENDLDMAGVSFEPIGISRSFRGVFDGNGHVIHNLTISKPNDNNVALFGQVTTGFSVKSLILDGAIIAGNYDVGALVGYFSFGCNIENCLVVNSHVTANGRAGIIIGCWSSNATLSGNLYRNCSSVTIGGNTSTTNIGAQSSDREGAVLSNASITLPEGVRIVSGGVAYNGTVYTASGATVTLGASDDLPEGFAISRVTYTPDGGTATACTDNGDGTFSFTMPAEGDVTVDIANGPATWAAVSALFDNASTDPDAPTEVVLAADITAGASDTYFTLLNAHHLRLDLNGHTINRNMSAPAADGYVIEAKQNSSLTILDSSPGQTGTITGGWGNANTGCIRANKATLRLEGGNITGNRVDYQGGSAVNFSGTFYMTGGTITGNIANAGNPYNSNTTACGAVYFATDGSFYMSGGSITGNYCGATTAGSAGIGFYLGMGTKSLHLTGSFNISGNQQGTYDEATGTWSDLQPNDYVNTNRCHIHLDDAIETTAPMVMVLCSIYGYYTDFTRGWSTYMDGSDPEDYFTLLPYVTDRGIGVVDGEATIGTLHAITLGENITASATSAAPGRPVTLGYNNLPEGYQMEYTVTIDGTDPAETVAVTDGTFVMPDGDVTVAVTLHQLYAITLPAETPHGTVTSDKASAIEGETVTLTAVPDAGYALGTLTVMNGNTPVATTAGENGTYTFVMPAAPVTVAAEFVLPIDSINFPDANFRNYLLSRDYGSDGVLTSAEIAGITFIHASDKNISDLTGIEHFTALTQLNCTNNQLTVLDVSHNTALTKLYCDKNQFTALDVSHNTALTILDCYKNQLTALDVSNNTALTQLTCDQNQLTALDVSNNTELEYLQCYSNQLTALDVSHNTALTLLQCFSNQLTALDVSHNTALTDLSCSSNQLTSLDVSHNTALTYLSCSSNQLTSLDVSHNTALKSLSCADNQLTTLDVSLNTALMTLYCHDNQINGANMAALVASMPTVANNGGRNGDFYVIKLTSDTEQNVITTTQVATARGKNWTVYGHTNWWQEYDGSEPPACDITLPDETPHGTVECDKTEAAEGETVTLTVTPDAGYALGTLTVMNGDTPVATTAGENGTYTFTMPDGDVTVSAVFGLAIDSINFPDANFRNWLLSTYYGDDRVLTDEEIAYFTYIDVQYRSIADLTGIEHFTALKQLTCNNNQLTTLDVSDCTALETLFCNNNQLTMLDASGCTALERLDCYDNQLTTLDVSGCTALTDLYCYDNQLTTLDVSGCTALTNLYCDNNQLTTLDVSYKTALTNLWALNNQLTSLDVSGCTALSILYCQTNQLTSLDVSGCTALIDLECSDNQINGENMAALVASLPTVAVGNGVFYVIDLDSDTEQNVITTTQVATARGKNWTVIGCTNERWEEYDGSEPHVCNITLPDETPHGTVTSDKASAIVGETVTLTAVPDAGYALGTLTVMNGDTPVATTAGENGTYTFTMPDDDVTVSAVFGLPIDSINFPDANFRNYLLSRDYGSDRVLTDEEIAGITFMGVSSKNISDLTGIEHFTALTQLSCDYNQLTALDVSHNTALTKLYCGNNQFTALDVSHNTALTILDCCGNQLTALDVSNNTALTQLTCDHNQLTALDVSNNTELKYLQCYSNQLTALDVSHNTALTYLDCSDNQFTALDVSHNTALTDLSCSSNQLTSLDVSHNTALTYLSCSSNPLGTLDVSHNTALKSLSCADNQLTTLDVSLNTALTSLYCYDNQINGENMVALVASMPTVDLENSWGQYGTFSVIDLDSETEQNVITTTQVATARGKNWTVYGRSNWWQEYDGSDPAFAINLPSEFDHGTVECDKATAAVGETVTLTVTPDEGYELNALTVTIVGDEPSGISPLRLRGGELVELTAGDEPNTYTFAMPAAPVTVNATFVETIITAVTDITTTQPTGQRYNIMGQPVGNDYKGIVIENGRKKIVF